MGSSRISTVVAILSVVLTFIGIFFNGLFNDEVKAFIKVHMPGVVGKEIKSRPDGIASVGVNPSVHSNDEKNITGAVAPKKTHSKKVQADRVTNLDGNPMAANPSVGVWRIQIDGDIPSVSQAVKERLGKGNFGSCLSSCVIQVNYRARMRQEFISGEYFSELDLLFDFYKQGKKIASRKLNVDGQSVISQAASDANAIGKVEGEMSERNIFSALEILVQ